jgi:hypothetical protein
MGSTSQITPQQFFSTLYRGVGGSFIEIRPLLDSSDPRKKTDEGPKLEASARRFFAIEKAGAEKASEYCLTLKGVHVYFGVGLRAKPGTGTKANIGCVTAAFADIDFKHVPQDQAIASLRAMPFKPSIIVLSGNGAHVYWLLVEPVYQSGLPKLEALNREILRACGAQVGTQDATRILRVPGTANVKPEYPDPKPVAQVVLFEPTRRYDLEAMLSGLKVNFPPPSASPPEASQASGGEAPIQAVPTRELSPELTQKLAELLTGIWIESHRHYLSIYLAGALAHAGYSQGSATRLIQGVCSLASDPEILDREKAVQGTYQKYVSGAPVAGSPTLEEMIEQFPGVIRDRARKVYEIVRKSIPRDQKKSTSSKGPDFKINKLVKFDTRPARWVCSGETGAGQKFAVTCEETAVLFNYHLFQAAAFEQAHIMLGEIKGTVWKELLGTLALTIETRETPKEARPEGAIELALEEFLESAKLNPEIGLLRSYPGYDEGSHFMKIEAFRKTLKDRGLKIDDRLMYERVKSLGWKSGTKRFGEKIQRLWIKTIPQNGHPSPTPPPAPQKTLFDQKGGGK